MAGFRQFAARSCRSESNRKNSHCIRALRARAKIRETNTEPSAFDTAPCAEKSFQLLLPCFFL
jgi:hypothetical protein